MPATKNGYHATAGGGEGAFVDALTSLLAFSFDTGFVFDFDRKSLDD